MKLLTSQDTIYIIAVSLVLYLFTGCSSTYYNTSLEPPPKFNKELDLLKPEAATTRSAKYTVKRGDTIWRIAYDHGTSPDAIIKRNHIKEVTDITPGQQLIIPAGFTGTRKTYFRTSSTLTGKSHASFIWPLQGKVLSRFGQWTGGKKNTGIDIKAFNGQSIKASKGGIVALISDTPDGWGRVVILQHDDGSYTWYAHNSEIFVKKGDRVAQGRTIAKAGSTGNAKRDKLHFKIFSHGMPVNPLYYLP